MFISVVFYVALFFCCYCFSSIPCFSQDCVIKTDTFDKFCLIWWGFASRQTLIRHYETSFFFLGICCLCPWVCDKLSVKKKFWNLGIYFLSMIVHSVVCLGSWKIVKRFHGHPSIIQFLISFTSATCSVWTWKGQISLLARNVFLDVSSGFINLGNDVLSSVELVRL